MLQRQTPRSHQPTGPQTSIYSLFFFQVSVMHPTGLTPITVPSAGKGKGIATHCRQSAQILSGSTVRSCLTDAHTLHVKYLSSTLAKDQR